MSKPVGPTHFEIAIGSTWIVSMTWWLSTAKTSAKDLTSYTAAMDIRRRIGDDTALVELTSAGGHIVLGGTGGTIIITIDNSVTATIDPGTAVFDLELTDSAGEPSRLLYGTAEFTQQVTR